MHHEYMERYKRMGEETVRALRSKKVWNTWPRIMRARWLSWTGHIILRTDWHSVFTNLNRGEPVWLVFFTYAHLCKRETVSEERTVWRAFRRGSLPGKGDTWRNWREYIYIYWPHRRSDYLSVFLLSILLTLVHVSLYFQWTTVSLVLIVPSLSSALGSVSGTVLTLGPMASLL